MSKSDSTSVLQMRFNDLSRPPFLLHKCREFRSVPGKAAVALLIAADPTIFPTIQNMAARSLNT